MADVNHGALIASSNPPNATKESMGPKRRNNPGMQATDVLIAALIKQSINVIRTTRERFGGCKPRNVKFTQHPCGGNLQPTTPIYAKHAAN